jgi:hypothetical protein
MHSLVTYHSFQSLTITLIAPSSFRNWLKGIGCLIYTVAKPSGGILFGLAFWTIAKNLSNQFVKRYMLISAFGMMLLFAANRPTFLVLVPYPPFGLVTCILYGLSIISILFGNLFGIYLGV